MWETQWWKIQAWSVELCLLSPALLVSSYSLKICTSRSSGDWKLPLTVTVRANGSLWWPNYRCSSSHKAQWHIIEMLFIPTGRGWRCSRVKPICCYSISGTKVNCGAPERGGCGEKSLTVSSWSHRRQLLSQRRSVLLRWESALYFCVTPEEILYLRRKADCCGEETWTLTKRSTDSSPGSVSALLSFLF